MTVFAGQRQMNGLTVRVDGGNSSAIPPPAASAPTASTSPVAGTVAGSVLAAARRNADLTQEQFAVRLQIAPATVQGWEQGTRSLLKVPLGKIGFLRRTLDAAEVDGELLRSWESALRVEEILADIAEGDPRTHPLAFVVPDRATTELLAWPITGARPRQLSGTTARLDIPAGHRNAILSVLRHIAEQAHGDDERSAMLRRQTRYLLATDPDSSDWIREQQAADLRNISSIAQWSPTWPLVRSTAITAAAAGDLDPLRSFIQYGLRSDDGVTANLNYWAYWVGEFPSLWSADSAMTQVDTDSWTGAKLLETLLHGVIHAPYRDLCAHTLWALLRRHRGLFTRPSRQQQVTASVSAALDNDQLDQQAKQALDQVVYTMEALA